MKLCPIAHCQFNRGFNNVASVCDLGLDDLTQCKIYSAYQEAKKGHEQKA